jgi:hypothetical protein
MLMAVMVPMPREKWTDERLDDLNKKVDDGFARLDRRIDRLDEDIKDLRREMNDRFEALNRNLIGGFFVLLAAILGSNAF